MSDLQKHNSGSCGQRCFYCAEDVLTEAELQQRIERDEAAPFSLPPARAAAARWSRFARQCSWLRFLRTPAGSGRFLRQLLRLCGRQVLSAVLAAFAAQRDSGGIFGFDHSPSIRDAHRCVRDLCTANIFQIYLTLMHSAVHNGYVSSQTTNRAGCANSRPEYSSKTEKDHRYENADTQQRPFSPQA
jgi:hypothetical protein